MIGATKAFESGWTTCSRDRCRTPTTRRSRPGTATRSSRSSTNRSGGPRTRTSSPTADPQAYLQARYTAPFTDYDKAIAQEDAGDGSAWSSAHAEYQSYFRQAVEAAGYEDLLLMNTDGDVVYSAYAGADLGTNLESGPTVTRTSRPATSRRSS